MNWHCIVALILKVGVEQAFSIWKIVQEHGEPDEAAWEKLRALSLKTYDEYISDAKLRASRTILPDATKPDV